MDYPTKGYDGVLEEGRWTDTDGKVHAESVGNVKTVSKRAADKLRRAKANDLAERRALADPTPGRVTCAKFFDLWLTHCRAKGLRPSTIASYVRDVRRAAPVFGHVLLPSVSPVHLALFLGKCHERGLSRASTRSAAGSIRAAFTWAVEQRMIPPGTNPFSKPGIAKTQPTHKRIYSRVEIDAMIAVSSDPWAGLIAVMAFCGLRWSEALNLQPRDVTPPEPGCPTGWLRVTAKRAGPRSLVFEAKSHQERRIPMTRDVWERLERLLPKAGLTGYFFLNDQDLRRLLDHQAHGKLTDAAHWLSNVNRTFGGRGRRGDLRGIQGRARDWLAQEPDGIRNISWERGSVHDLRRTYATAMANAGLPSHKLMEYMGHASITTTMEPLIRTGPRIG